MKKILNTIVLLLITQMGFTQYFTLTPNGFVSEDKNDYIVIDVPNAKQNDLYKNVLNALSAMYKNPKDALSLIEGESITLNGYEEKVILYKDKISPLQIGKTTYQYDLSYTLSILFKDGKIRFNRPTFECRRWYEDGYRSGWASGWTYLHLVKGKNAKAAIFGQKGEIMAEESYNGLNQHLNSLIKEIIEKSTKIDDW